MTPMALLDILDEDLRGAHLTAASIAEVAAVILGTGVFSFGLIFAEVSDNRRERSGVGCQRGDRYRHG